MVSGVDPDNLILVLIAANIAIFLMWQKADSRFMKENFMISVDNFISGRLHTLITSAFSHIRTGHLVSNMLALYVFGTSIGSAFGPEFLLKLYLAGALGGSVCYLVYQAFLIPSKSKQMEGRSPPSVPALGASGALNAIMLFEILLNPKRIIFVEMIIPVPALLAGVYLIGSDMIRVIKGDTRVSGSAHLGGAAVGVMAWLQYKKRRFY
ncbi:RHOMBOID-like protein 12, mitochondrial [Apium graveolens]|uniref:RHOMBOID-like protein 12, mitochondrial n=1 Tax=Apium graveolens TaxID=4045 RepID=UPI003D7B7DB7